MDKKKVKRKITAEDEQNYKELIGSIFKWIILSLIMSVPIGVIVGFYNIVLKNTNKFRENHQWLIYFLPIAGIVIAFIYLKTKRNSYTGKNLLKLEVEKAATNIPWYMAFIAFLGSFLTTLCGGSAGKEGSAISMGGSIGDFIAQRFNLSDELQRTLVVSGVGAGFGVIYDAPFAGALLGMELVLKGNFHYSSLIPAFLTAAFSNEVAKIIGNQEISYPMLHLEELNMIVTGKLVCLGIIFGIAGFIFNYAMDNSGKMYNKITKSPYIKAIIGGVLTIILFWIAGDDYNGLGHSFIREAFDTPTMFMDSAWKLIFTAIALGSGFQGGRGNPTLFVGVALGSWLAKYFNLPLESCAALGMIGVFCGASSLPLTSIALSVEYFGGGEMLAVMIVTTISFIISGFYDIFTKKKLSKGKDEIFEGKVADSK